MEFEWDEAKNAANRAKHGIGFELAPNLDWARATPVLDHRRAYGEDRFIVYVYFQKRLFVCAYTLRNGRKRLKSLRKANARERKQYG